MIKALVFALLLAALVGMARPVSGQSQVSTGADTQSSRPVTFTKDVAPIIFAHCSSCHRPGQVAPFSLLTYEDIRPRAAEIAAAIRSRSMPPWKPEPGYGEFAGARGLSSEQLALVQHWADGGFARGDSADLPPQPTWSSGWQLGQPDLVLTMPEPFTLRGDGQDVLRTFVIPIPIESRRYVKALEFDPGNARVVHHANIKIDRSRQSRSLDEEEPGPGYVGSGGREARFPDGNFLGWTPGQSPRTAEPGKAWRLEPGSDLVVELHLMPSGKPESLRVSVGLFFTDEVPSTRVPYMIRLGRQDIDIAAGDSRYENTDSYILPVDVDLIGVQPHAHYLAKEIEGYATLPDGTRKALILIRNWDFNWQDVYRYSSPIPLPKGTKLAMRYTYDNSAGNRRNPSSPPKRVTFGQASSSEMGTLWIQVVPRSSDDLQILDSDFSPKMLREDTAGASKMLESDPENPALHASLAACYLEAGRVADAITELQTSARLDPSFARHYELGKALLGERRLTEAVPHLSEAVRLKPDFAEGFNDLGIASHLQGKLDEAVRAYKRALEISPGYAESHFNLGRALTAQGKPEEAIAEYRRALELKPEDPEFHSTLASQLAAAQHIDEAVVQFRQALRLQPDLPGALMDLAWILATSERADVRAPAEAIRLAEHAAELTDHHNAAVLDTLAAAYAAGGRLDNAISTAQAALALASASRDAALANRIRQRLTFYEQHK